MVTSSLSNDIVTLAEWLTRWPAKPFPFGSAGSSPAVEIITELKSQFQKGFQGSNLYLFEDIKVAKPPEVVEKMEKQ
ncbi:hypothetical protein H8356DRAFT_1342897 [Neocallimastix lanati (nom. inval.)]|nr:hypothetical protein H8356DRAFT_1342897 [Neocallimastix sp. JGI-2020a]